MPNREQPSATGLIAYAERAFRSGRTGDAVELLLRAIQAHPNSFESAILLSTIVRSQGDKSNALHWAKKAVDIQPSSAEAHTALGLAFLAQSDSSSAIECFKRAIELKPVACLEWNQSCLTPELGDSLVLTASHWQVRQPLYSSSVGRWENYAPWLGELARLES